MNRKLIQTLLAILITSMLLTAPRAQQATAAPPKEDRIALYQALLDLTNPWTVMCIAAHPDDEDGTSLIVMRRKYGAHTVSLFSTFGEGGQNAIGPELYEELGAIRARETQAASEIQGSEPHFLGLKDFGFSKSADEAFRFWGHEEALRRMVLEIRRLRPDVIITNHSVTNNDHGHHQATARLEIEAFDAAADPTRFPEQLKDGVDVWQVQRLFVRVRGSQNQNQTDAPLVTIDPNERDPIREATFSEEALSALQKHATQGPWPQSVAQMAARFANSADGRLPLIRYRLALAAKSAVAPLPPNARSFLEGLKLPAGDSGQLALLRLDQRVLTDLASNPSAAVRELLNAKVADDLALISGDPKRNLLMQDKGRRALIEAAGLTLSAEPARQPVIPGSSVQLGVTLSNHGQSQARLLGCSARPWSRTEPVISPAKASNADPIAPGTTLRRTFKVDIPASAAINVPLASHLYDPSWKGLNLETTCSVAIEASTVKVRTVSQLDVAPALEIADISPSPLVITSAKPARASSFTVTVTNHQSTAASGRLALTTNVSPTLTVENGPSFSLAAGETKRIQVAVPNSIGQQAGSTQAQPALSGTIPLSVLVLRAGSKESISTRSVQVVSTNVSVASNLRVGYVRGFDFSLPNALNALSVESKELSVDEVKTSDLQKYTSIIVDNRVYESTPGLVAANQKLLDYAKAGGTLIVFYHKSFEWNPDPRRNRPDQLAPYKLILGDERITDENAAITFLEPQHPLLNFPNKMGQEDFAGWIQERGLYYPKEWDPQFQTLLQSNDPGEAPLKGGLLVADFGRGKYIYTSMVWYRELRAGVPGSYRMLANMISYGHGN